MKIELKKGMFFYDHQYNYKYHIVSIISDGANNLVVFRYFGKHKQWWHYELKHYWDMESWFECNLYSFKRYKKDIK